jgi:pimeloyl-ACP methyl ester carboxylesterase
MIERISKSMSPPDTEVLRRRDVADTLGRSRAESFRQGIGAGAWDGVAVARGDGFRLEEIQSPVLIWHGEQDRNDPVTMAHAQERRLPHVRAGTTPTKAA